MIDIQSATAEIRRAKRKKKKEERKKEKPQGKNIMACPIPHFVGLLPRSTTKSY